MIGVDALIISGFVLPNSLLELKTFILMAKFELKFLSNDDQDYSIKCWSQFDQIVITTEHHDGQTTICLDKSTAIKFAKTLRTEINKITEREVNNG